MESENIRKHLEKDDEAFRDEDDYTSDWASRKAVIYFKKNSVCTTFDRLMTGISTEEMFTECKGYDANGRKFKGIYVRIQMREFNCIVSLESYVLTLRHFHEKYFAGETFTFIVYLLETDKVLPTTMSVSTAFTSDPDYVNADHCQDGTHKKVFKMSPTPFNNEFATLSSVPLIPKFRQCLRAYTDKQDIMLPDGQGGFDHILGNTGGGGIMYDIILGDSITDYMPRIFESNSTSSILARMIE